MDWYLMAWRRFADFSGRSRRKEYWMFAFFNCIFSLPVGIASLLLKGNAIGIILQVLYLLYCLAALIPSMAVYVRRLHDTGRSGSWWLIGIVPIVGEIILLVYLVSDSEPRTNKYGPIPKMEVRIADEKAAAVADAVTDAATAEDYQEWLQFVARQPRPFPRPGTTLQSEYVRWLIAHAKRGAKAS